MHAMVAETNFADENGEPAFGDVRARAMARRRPTSAEDAAGEEAHYVRPLTRATIAFVSCARG
eukprot:2012043-Lingulodinium_polyedra.AAC.1